MVAHPSISRPWEITTVDAAFCEYRVDDTFWVQVKR
jgi:hypothetical protein